MEFIFFSMHLESINCPVFFCLEFVLLLVFILFLLSWCIALVSSEMSLSLFIQCELDVFASLVSYSSPTSCMYLQGPVSEVHAY